VPSGLASTGDAVAASDDALDRLLRPSPTPKSFVAESGRKISGRRRVQREGETTMADLIFLALTVLLFRASVWYVRRCDRM